MNKNISKKSFMKKLKFYLSFYFEEEECISILQDYEEWFVNETLQGKTEEEICFSLNSPKKVVSNLLIESRKSLPQMPILLQNTMIQTVLLLMIHFFISTLLLKICDRNVYSYLYFAFGIVFASFIIGITIKFPYKCYFDNHIFYRNNLVIFGFTTVIILFQLFVLPKIKYVGSGILCVRVLTLFIICLYLINIYFVVGKLYQIKDLAFFTILHTLGVITLLFYNINQLHMLYVDVSQWLILPYGSIAIYLETIVLCCLFYIQKHIRKRI